MKVLFLDVDGVLNNYDTWCISNDFPFLSSCFDRLKTIIDRTGAKIVLHSSWRYYITPLGDREFESKDNHCNQLLWELDNRGLELYDKINDNDSKALGILNWITKHTELGPFIEKYVIVDDEQINYKEPRISNDLLVQTDPLIGLSDEDVEIIVSKLNA